MSAMTSLGTDLKNIISCEKKKKCWLNFAFFPLSYSSGSSAFDRFWLPHYQKHTKSHTLPWAILHQTYKFATVWNDIENYLKSLQSKVLFKTNLKYSMLNAVAGFTCNKLFCYSCSIND